MPVTQFPPFAHPVVEVPVLNHSTIFLASGASILDFAPLITACNIAA